MFAGIVAGLEVMESKFNNIKDVGMGMMGAGMRGFQELGSFVIDMMKSSSQYEMAMKSMQTIGGLSKKQASDIGDTVREIVAFTPFMEGSLLDLSSAMVRAGVSTDAFASKTTLLDAFNKGLARVDQGTLSLAGGMKMNALTSLTDFIAATKQAGVETETYFKTMQRYLQTGKWSMRAPIAKPIEKELEAAGKKGIEAMLAAIQKVNVEKSFMGFSAAASSTVEGIVSNFKEIPEQVYKMMAQVGDKTGPYERIKSALIDVFAVVQEAFRDKGFIGSFRELMEPLADVIVNALHLVAKGIKFISDTIKNNPGLTKFIGVMVLVVPTVLIVVGAITAAIGAIGAFAASLAVLGVIIGGAVLATVLALGSALLPIIFACGLITVAIASLGVALGVGIAGSWDKIATLAWKISTLIKGVVEALWNWEGATSSVSTKTAIELEKSGMAPAFFRILGIIYDMQKAITSVYDRLSEKGPDGVSTMDKLKDSVNRVWYTIEGLILSITVLFPRASQDVGKTGGMFGFLATMVEWGTSALDAMIPAVASLMKAFAKLHAIISKIGFGIKTIKGYAHGFMNIIPGMKYAAAAALPGPAALLGLAAAGKPVSPKTALAEGGKALKEARAGRVEDQEYENKLLMQAIILEEDYRQRQEKDKRDREKGITPVGPSNLADKEIKALQAAIAAPSLPGLGPAGGIIPQLPGAGMAPGTYRSGEEVIARQWQGPKQFVVEQKTELTLPDVGKIAEAVNKYNYDMKGMHGQPTYGEGY